MFASPVTFPVASGTANTGIRRPGGTPPAPVDFVTAELIAAVRMIRTATTPTHRP
jgi:hypothetical protein